MFPGLCPEPQAWSDRGHCGHATPQVGQGHKPGGPGEDPPGGVQEAGLHAGAAPSVPRGRGWGRGQVQQTERAAHHHPACSSSGPDV